MEADGSGWCLGDLNGTLGWFPGNYVEKIQKKAAPIAPAPVAMPPQAAAPVFAPNPAALRSTPAPAPAIAKAPAPAPVAQRPISMVNKAPAPSPVSTPPPTGPKIKSAPAAPPMMGGGAPPPPPMMGGGAPPPPPAPAVSAPPSGAGRGALLNSIQGGAKLKKTVTNDRSAAKF